MNATANNDDMDIEEPEDPTARIDSELEKCGSHTPLFNIVGRFRAKVVEIKDGDTIRFDAHYNNKIQRFVGRMDNYDTQPLKKLADDDKDFAIRAKLHLHKLLWDKIVTVKSNGFDKYNNLLVVVYLDTLNVNKDMIKHGFGKRGRSNRKQPKES